MPISIGTSGWSYDEWRGNFYPPGLRANGRLCFYAGVFNAVEINASAYRLPTASTVQQWAADMPPGFIAAVKLSHTITHHRRLRGARTAFADFVAVASHLGAHRGPILAQLPPGFLPDHARLDDFLGMAREVMDDAGWPLAVEFRDSAWYGEHTARILGRHGAGWCVADMPGGVVDEPGAGAPFLYLRRHGTTGKYVGSYSDEALERDATLLRAYAARGLPAYAFFNNTADGAAARDARRLCTLAGVVVPPDPAPQARIAFQEHP